MMGGVQAILQGVDEQAAERGKILRRLLGELAPYKDEFLVAGGFVFLVALCQALGPYMVSQAIDQHIAKGDGPGLGLVLLMMAAVYVTGWASQRAQIYRLNRAGQRVLFGMRARLFERFQTLPVAYFDRRPIGDLMSRVTSDVDTLNQLLSQGLVQAVGATLSVIGILSAMLYLNPQLGLVALASLPTIGVVLYVLARRARHAYRQTRVATGDVMAGLQEEVGGVREAQAFNRTDENVARFRTRNATNRDANIQAAAVTAAFSPVIDLMATLVTTAVVGYGAWLCLHGQLTVGLLAAFMLYIGQFFWPIQLVAGVSAQMQAAAAGAERIYAILDEPVEREAANLSPETNPSENPGGAGATTPSPAPQPQQPSARLEYRGVGFAYVPERPVLTDVSFTVEPGQTVAIVGPTGAGKTSIANLLPRFYDVTAGSIWLNGCDIREMPRTTLRHQIALVSQEPFLFGGTIAENLAYGRPEATREEIITMAKALGADAFIEALPQGYDTPLGEGATRLGHGQRQLLAIARAMLADRPILLLDEATSHVDSATEAGLQQALAQAMQGRTTLVIAHRLSTIRHADLILVVDGGRIVERGTHAELAVAGGLYTQLNRRYEAATSA